LNSIYHTLAPDSKSADRLISGELKKSNIIIETAEEKVKEGESKEDEE
jgi:hypothetical protein